MKIIWSQFASEMLADIFKYYKKNANESVAKRIKTNIFSSTKQLKSYPVSGQLEPNLESLKENHRYLVVGNFKIIYKEVKEGIFNF